MENVESPTKPISVHLSTRPTERNVLKEFNNIEGTTKSSKETSTTDQPEVHVVKEPTNNNSSSGSNKVLSSKESVSVLQSGHKINNLNETQTLLSSEGFLTRPQDATFISTNGINNQTVVFGAASPKLDEKIEAHSNIEPVNFLDATQVIQVDKTGDFKANQTVNMDVDSLVLDGKNLDSSFDLLKMKQSDPSTPPDQRLPIDTAEKIFSSRKAPTFSEMFPSSIQSTNKPNNFTTNQPWDASFVIEKTDLANEKSPLDSNDNVPLMLENAANDEFGDYDFKHPPVPLSKSDKQQKDNDNFIVLNSNDFDFLQSRGANSVDPENDPRSSLLLRFDPLTRRSLLHPTLPRVTVQETDDLNKTLTSSNRIDSDDNHSINELPSNGVLVAKEMDDDTNSFMNNVKIDKNGDKVISVDGVLLTNKKIDVTSVDENIRKKMEEYEATQEILLKRITEKDKAITKTSNVLELYEKAIAEALAAKEKLSQNYEKEHEELKADRDVTFQHLLSLESTFADLHMKFERNVQYTGQLQEKLNAVAEDKSKAEDLLRQQELRYDKMKSHTMQQFDIANAKLEQQTKTISLDNTKLKAQIKREEIHKNAVAEELSQKKKENEELVKICDELISGQRN